MSAVTTFVATVAAAAGGVALYRYLDKKTRSLREKLSETVKTSRKETVIDYERDPESGVFKPKSDVRH